MNNAMKNATPTKLRNGEWGARVTGSVNLGEVVKVRTKAGKEWEARIVRIVWTDGGVTICQTRSDTPRPQRSRSRSYSDIYCGGICPVGGFRCSSRNGPCHDCQ